MALKDQINKKPVTSDSRDFYAVGEFVELIVLKEMVPNKYKKDYDAWVEEQVALGHKGPVTNYLNYGIAFKCAIVKRNLKDNLTGGKETITVNSEEVTIGDIPITTYIDYIPPTRMQEEKYPDLSYGKGFFGTKNGAAVIGLLQPSSMPARDFQSGKTAIDVTIEEEKEFAQLLEREKNRVAEWNTLFDDWDAATEEDRRLYLCNRLAKRYAIGTMNGDEFVPTDIEPGVKFTGKVVSAKFPYVTIQSIDVVKKEIYSTLDSKPPTALSVSMADAIHTALAIQAATYKKKVGNNGSDAEGNDEPPF